jgi:PAS domain S-box-containing protein
VKAFEVGGTDYIPKPFHHLEVLARVRHHLQLRLTQIALENSEQRFRTIFEQASIGICVTQPDGQIVETNAAFQGFLGHSATALAQQREQDFLHPEDLAADPEPNAALGRSRHEKRYRHATGDWVWGRVTRCAAQSPEGQLLFTFSMVENIQTRKQVEAALETSEHEMRTVFTAMSDLVLVIRPARAEIQVMPTR